MYKVKINQISSILIAFSILLFAFRGKIGAIAITCAIVVYMYGLIKQTKGHRPWANAYTACFIFLFAFVINAFRSLSLEYYMIIGYFLASLTLLSNRFDGYDELWKWLKYFSIFGAFGVYLQRFLPGVYYAVISLLLPNEVVASIRSRLIAGYYTGFSREVSYTMFLVVVGLGLYIFAETKKNRRNDRVAIVFLLGALLLSGKRATLVFFILAWFITSFIKSDDKLKIFKYSACVFVGLMLVIVTFPYWSKIPIFSRIVEVINFASLDDLIGITNGRTVIYSNAISLWNTNRWFGIGWSNFKHSVPSIYWYSGFDVHNCFLQILCETGIIGLVLYSLICIISVTSSIKCIYMFKHSRLENNYNYGLSLFFAFIQVFFILYSLTEPILYEYTDYIVFFICFGCTNVMLKSFRRKQPIRRIRSGIEYGKIARKEFNI